MSRSVVRKQNYRILKSGMTNNCNGLEEDKIAWCSNPSHKLGNMPKGLEEEITGVSNACYTLHHGALRIWKRIELHDTQTKAVFYDFFAGFGRE